MDIKTDIKKDETDMFIKLMTDFMRKVFNPGEAFKNQPIPPSHMKTIFHLMRHGPCTITQAARELGISKPNMTPILDKLSEEGYINRYPDPKDRRSLRIESTQKAQELFDRREEFMKEAIRQKLSVLSPKEMQELTGLIEKMLVITEKLE